MRLSATSLRKSCRLTALAAAASAGLGVALTPAVAGNPYHDEVYADSFGNLVVYSAAGYKRIVVGQGHLADELSRYGAGGPTVVYPEAAEPAPRKSDARKSGDCRQYGVRLHGRSYMYGLPENVVPVLGVTCY